MGWGPLGPLGQEQGEEGSFIPLGGDPQSESGLVRLVQIPMLMFERADVQISHFVLAVRMSAREFTLFYRARTCLSELFSPVVGFY